MATAGVHYRLIAGTWQAPGRSSVAPGSGGGPVGGLDPTQQWTATTGFTVSGNTWTSSVPTDNGDGTWTGNIT